MQFCFRKKLSFHWKQKKAIFPVKNFCLLQMATSIFWQMAFLCHKYMSDHGNTAMKQCEAVSHSFCSFFFLNASGDTEFISLCCHPPTSYLPSTWSTFWVYQFLFCRTGYMLRTQGSDWSPPQTQSIWDSNRSIDIDPHPVKDKLTLSRLQIAPLPVTSPTLTFMAF